MKTPLNLLAILAIVFWSSAVVLVTLGFTHGTVFFWAAAGDALIALAFSFLAVKQWLR